MTDEASLLAPLVVPGGFDRNRPSIVFADGIAVGHRAQLSSTRGDNAATRGSNIRLTLAAPPFRIDFGCLGKTMSDLPEPGSDFASRTLTLLDRYPATPYGHIGFLEFVRDEVHNAAEAKRQRFPHAYPNETIERMVQAVKWAEARERLTALPGLPADTVVQVARVLGRDLTVGTVEQIDDLLQPAMRALRDAFEHNRAADLTAPGLLASHPAPPEQKATASEDDGGAEEPRKLQPFTGGTMVFFEDRVELCGVDICSGPRSKTLREALELLRVQRQDGKFASYSGAVLARTLNLKGANSAAGVIRNLRKQIGEALREADIDCGSDDVVLSGGPGYRLSAKLTVQVESGGDQGHRDELRHDDVPDSHVRNVPDDHVPDVPDDAVPNSGLAIRQKWILEQLNEGSRLKRQDIVDRFNVSDKTAKRDLSALKAEGKVELVGSGRSSYYRLCKHLKGDSSR